MIKKPRAKKYCCIWYDGKHCKEPIYISIKVKLFWIVSGRHSVSTANLCKAHYIQILSGDIHKWRRTDKHDNELAIWQEIIEFD
jgi:hypothetical protein